MLEKQSETHSESFNFDSPEDVLIEVVGDEMGSIQDWEGYSIESCTVLNPCNGAATYEASYGGFLDYTIMNMVLPPGEGWWVVEKVTGYYSKGDGWTTDDNMDFYCEGIRRATPEEIAQS